MADQATYDTITTPAFETALRAKANDVLTSMSTLEAQASPVTFTVTGISIAMSWGTRDIEFKIDDAYDIVQPLAWVTAAP